MSNQRVVDTNLIIRHLLNDHPAHSQAAKDLFLAAGRGEVGLILLPTVVAECVFVLESFYKHSRTDVAKAIALLIASRGIELADQEIHLDAFDRYQNTNLHFVDCIVAATAFARKIDVATFDGGFKKFPDIRVNVAAKSAD